MLRLALFGGFSLAREEGTPLVVASRKCRALLAYLALEPRPVPRDRLAALLWGDGPESRARGSLRQALTTLRHELPGDGAWLAATAEAVAVAEPALWVDVREADQLLRTGQAQRFLDLSAGGEVMAGWSPVTPEFDDWREAEQRRWRERESAALRTLAERARAAGRDRELLALGRRLLRLEPWNEEAHRLVMQALAALGRHSEALRQYRLAREALRDELGVAPGPETERLMLEVRAQRTAAPAAAATTTTAPTTAPGAAEAKVAAAAQAPDDGAAGPVGRQMEVHQIEGLLQGCRTSGRGHVVVIRGEAGMGKTTLLRQALQRAEQAGFATHLVRVGPLGAARNLEVVRGVLEALEVETGTPAEHRLSLDELRGTPLAADEAAVAEALDPAARADAHARALEELVRRAGALRPRVLAVEDLHWCDPETTRLLCTVAAAAPLHHTVMVFTCRSGEEPGDLAWAALVRRGSFTSIDLGPLDGVEAAALAARWVDLAPEAVQRCIERAAGHPLFLIQLLDSGGAAGAVPGTVQAAVLTRLGRLPAHERRVLEAAAVLGVPFSAEQMARLLEQESVELGPLVRQGWLQPLGTGLTMAMAHDLLAAAVRASLDEPALARLHRRAAAWCASRDPLTSAEHLERAGDPGAAAAYLSVAGAALGEHRLDLAETVLRRVDACAAEPALSFEAMCLRGDVRRERGDPAGAHAVFTQAAGMVRAPEQQLRVQLGLAAALRLLDRHGEALRCLEHADALAGHDDRATRATLEQLRGNLLFALGDVAGCRSAHQRALDHARAADSPLDEAAALSGLGDAHYLEGRVASAGQAFEACRQLAHSQGILRMEAASSMMLGMTGLYAGDLPRAAAAAARSLEVASRIDDPRMICLAETVIAVLARERHDVATARAHGDRALAAARRLGSERMEALSLDTLARSLLAEGNRREALSRARQALTLCQRSGGLPLNGASLLATVGLAEADAEAGWAALRQGEGLLASGSPCHNHFELRRAGIDLARRHGDWAEARRHADALERHLGGEPSLYAALVIEGARVTAALASNPNDTAARRRLGELRARAETAGLAWTARGLVDPTLTAV
jgi:DNA-binding SARP family transcriptional activator